jgi:acyl dehydratase
MKGLFFDEVVIGEIDTLGSHHFTRDDIMRFARAFDPQPFHLDDDAAQASHFGGLCASGWHTAAGWMRCYVDFNARHRKEREARGERIPPIGPSPGFSNLRWIKPVYAGDTITYRGSITGKRPLGSRPGWGLVLFSTHGENQNGDVVFSFDGKVFVAMARL